jgi:hypothetical protein
MSNAPALDPDLTCRHCRWSPASAGLARAERRCRSPKPLALPHRSAGTTASPISKVIADDNDQNSEPSPEALAAPIRTTKSP